MKIDNAFGDGQTDTGSYRAASGRVFYLVKGFEYPVEVLRFDADTREMVLASVHPGITADMVSENTGWPLQISKQLTVTPEPTKEELSMLNRFDPEGYWTGA